MYFYGNWIFIFPNSAWNVIPIFTSSFLILYVYARNILATFVYLTIVFILTLLMKDIDIDL